MCCQQHAAHVCRAACTLRVGGWCTLPVLFPSCYRHSTMLIVYSKQVVAHLPMRSHHPPSSCSSPPTTQQPCHGPGPQPSLRGWASSDHLLASGGSQACPHQTCPHLQDALTAAAAAAAVMGNSNSTGTQPQHVVQVSTCDRVAGHLQPYCLADTAHSVSNNTATNIRIL